MQELKELVVERLLGVKWNLVAMGAVSLVFAVVVFTAPAHRLAEPLSLLPWLGIALGALGLVGSFVSTSGWVLGWTEIVMALAMFLVGFWTLFFPVNPVTAATFSQVLGFAGIFLAFYVLFVALAMDRAGCGNWVVELIVGIVALVASLAGLLGVAGVDGVQAVAALPLYLAAFGFLYGAAALSGHGSIEDAFAVFQRFEKKGATTV